MQVLSRVIASVEDPATTSTPASPKPANKAGSARSTGCRSASTCPQRISTGSGHDLVGVDGLVAHGGVDVAVSRDELGEIARPVGPTASGPRCSAPKGQSLER